MLNQLSSSHDNGQSMVIYDSCSEICFVSCHHLMTTVRIWQYIIHVLNMLPQLSSSHDNCQSMVIHTSYMQHALSIVIVSLQGSEHGYSSLRYETCSVIVIVS